MKELEIIQKKNSLYILKDNERKYLFTLEFHDIPKEPEVKDKIWINQKLLNPINEEYSTFYAFGNLDNICGRENLKKDDIDIIKVKIDQKEIYLKRLYG